MRWTDDYIGIPCADFGASYEGCHCYGLLMLVYREELGIELPAYDTMSAKNLRRIRKTVGLDTQRGNPNWERVEKPMEFDSVVMKAEFEDKKGNIHIWPVHVGIMCNDFEVMHTESPSKGNNIDTVIQDIGPNGLGWRIVGFYRHKEMIDEQDRARRRIFGAARRQRDLGGGSPRFHPGYC